MSTFQIVDTRRAQRCLLREMAKESTPLTEITKDPKSELVVDEESTTAAGIEPEQRCSVIQEQEDAPAATAPTQVRFLLLSCGLLTQRAPDRSALSCLPVEFPC